MTWFSHFVESEVKTKVESFAQCFRKMIAEASTALEKSGTTPERVIFFLSMPDAYFRIQKEHRKFLQTLNKAASIVQLFTALNEYWDHLNYHLLEQLIIAPGIENYIEKVKCLELKETMEQYVQDIDIFRRKTTIGVYCKVIANQKEEVPEGFKKMVTKHKKWSKDNTLQEVEDFRQIVAQEHKLHQCLVFFNNILFHSVEIIWWIPIEAQPLPGFQLGGSYTACEIEAMNTEGRQ